MPNKWETVPLDKEEKGKWETVPLTPEEQEQFAPGNFSALDAYIMGGTQGLGSRFTDEAAAKVESMATGKPYKEIWERKQKELNYLRSLYPAEMLASEIAGSIGGYLIPAGLIGKLAKAGYAIKSKAAADALQGGISGLGGSEHLLQDGIVEPLKDTVQGAVEGVIAGKLVRDVAAPAVKYAYNTIKEPIIEPVKKGAKKVLEVIAREMADPLFNVPREAAKRLLANPKAYSESPKTWGDPKEILEGTITPKINEVSGKVKSQTEAAIGQLDDSAEAMTVKEFKEMAERKMLENKAIIKDPESGKLRSRAPGALKTLKTELNLAKQLAGEKGFLSEADLYEFREALKPHAKYNSQPGSGSSNSAASAWKGIRGELNEHLKANEAYEDAIAPTRQMTSELNDVQKAIGLVRNQGDDLIEEGRYAIGADKTLNKTRALAKKKETTNAEKVLKEFGQKYDPSGMDWDVLLKRAQDAESFGFQAPSLPRNFMSGLLSLHNPVYGAYKVAADVVGPPLYRNVVTKAMTMPPVKLPDMVPFLNPAAVNLATNPILGEPNLYAPNKP